MARRWSHLRPDGRRSHRVHHLRVHRRAPPHAGGMAGAPRSRADTPTRRSTRDEAFRDAWVEKGLENRNARVVRITRYLIATGRRRASPTRTRTPSPSCRTPEASTCPPKPDAWGRTGVIALLRRNPDLLVDDVWRLFEVEGGENSLAAYDKYFREENTWRAALVELGEDGSLDRERLLDASLDALQRGFAQFRAQWFSAFHEALRPTPAEHAVRGRRPMSRSRRARSDRRPRWRSRRSRQIQKAGRSRPCAGRLADRSCAAGTQQGRRHPSLGPALPRRRGRACTTTRRRLGHRGGARPQRSGRAEVGRGAAQVVVPGPAGCVGRLGARHCARMSSVGAIGSCDVAQRRRWGL